MKKADAEHILTPYKETNNLLYERMIPFAVILSTHWDIPSSSFPHAAV